MGASFSTVEEYADSLPDASRRALDDVRGALRRAVPDGVETISYAMPTLTLDGRRVVHVAAWKRYLSVYPAPDTDTDADPELDSDLGPYRAERATLRFPLSSPMPTELIERVVLALVAQTSPAE